MKARPRKLLRVLGLLLALLMVAGTLAACSKTGNGGNTTGDLSGTSGEGSAGGETVPGTDPTTDPVTNEWGEDEVKHEIPKDVQFNNETLNIATRSAERWTREFVTDDLTDQVNKEIFYRNVAVESQLKIKIVLSKHSELTVANISNFTRWVLTSQMADTGEVDIVSGAAYFQTSSAIKDSVVNLHDPVMTYLDLSKVYWNQSYIDAASIYGGLYYVVGDMNLSLYDRTMVTFANYDTLVDLEYGDIFDIVTNYEWTYAKMLEIIKEYPYLEMDSVDGISAGDQISMISTASSHAWDSWLGGFRLNLVQKAEDGGLEFNILGNERISKGASLVHELNRKSGNTYLVSNSPMETFVGGNVLFMNFCLAEDPSDTALLRAFSDRYAILPVPMMDAEQKAYGATTQDSTNIMSVLNCSSVNKAMVSAYLELTCSKSYDSVRPMYVKMMLTGRYLAIPENVTVLNLILDSVYFDSGVIYSVTLNNLEWLWRAEVSAGNDPTVVWSSRQGADQTALDDLLTWYMTSGT